jgi:hypothetical protein
MLRHNKKSAETKFHALYHKQYPTLEHEFVLHKLNLQSVP